MKYPFSRRTILILGAVLAVIFIIGLIASQGKAKEVYVTNTVTRADVIKTVDVTGSLTPLSHADLSFQSSGNVASVHVRVGDTVSAGEVLATLDAADLSADARRAQAELEAQLAGTRDEDIAVAYADLLSAESSSRYADEAIQYVRATSASSITLAEDALENAKEENAETAQIDSRDIADAIQSGLVTVRASLSKADELLGVENTLFGNEFEREFGTLNPSTVSQAKDFFARAVTDRNLAEAAVISGDEIAGIITLRALEETASALLYTRQALDATSADSVDLSLTEIINYKANIDAARSNAEAARATLAASIADQTNNDLSSIRAVRSAELKLADAQTNADQNIARAVADAESARSNVTKAQAAHNKLLAGPRDVDVAPYRASRDAAWARYEKAVITSPIDGKIGRIDLRVGESAQPGVAVISIAPTKPSFAVTVDVPESDVTHLTLGDKATITFDAFGSDTIFTGSLTSLDLSEKLIEGVVFYEARIAVTSGERMADLRSGMSADVTVATDEKPNALVVPTRAVLEKDGKKIVRVLVNEEIVEKEVTVGLRGDGSVTEILSGLSEGETVVVSIKK